MAPQASRPVKVFISYSHKDDKLRAQLDTGLIMLRRTGVVQQWSDRRISPGEEWDKQISKHLESADIIILLVSPDFLASKYCYDIEVKRAMERHEAGEARVIPVILRRSDNWQAAPFGKLQALPKDARPVKNWPDRDDAVADVAAGIRRVVAELGWEPDEDYSAPENECPEVEGEPGGDDDAPRKNRKWRVVIPLAPAVGFEPRRGADRRDIVGRLVKELAPGRNGRVMLSGPGGVGKTTLAAEAARKLKDAYPERVVWSDAAGREHYTASSLYEDITIKLGSAPPHKRPDDEKEAEADKLIDEGPALIVIDSYEDIEPAERRHIEHWLEKSPCSALLVSQELTTRLDLNNVQVPLMRRSEAQKLLERLIKKKTQSPKIFTDEVRDCILDAAGGNPSALQLIVALIDSTQCPKDVLDALKRVEGEHAERAFERAFNHVYNLPQLGDDGRAALLALSLFRQGATQEALAHVTGFDRERRLEAVANLSRLSLLKPTDEDCRLGLENLTRRLARAALDRDERAPDSERRFVEYFREYIRREKWSEDADLGVVEAERSNVVAAMRLASEQGDWDTVLEFFDVTLNHVNTFVVWKRSVVAAEREAEDRLGDEAQRPPLLIEINHRHEYRPEAREHYRAIPKKLGLPGVPSHEALVGLKLPRRKWPRHEKWKLVVLSVAAFELGVCAHYRAGHSPPKKRRDKYQRARDYFEAAKKFKDAFEDEVGYAIACNNLGLTFAVEGRTWGGEPDWKKKALNELRRGLNKLKERRERLGKVEKFERVLERNIEWVKSLEE